MAAVVYPTPGKMYGGSITTITGSTGTPITGIAENDISLILDCEVRRRRTGVGATAGFRTRMGRVSAAVLIIQLRNQSTTGLKMQFSHLTTDGAIMRPTGGTATAEFAKLPTFPLIVRPTLTTEKYIYSPNWSMDEGSAWLATHSEIRAQLDGNVLALLATRPTNATGPAYEWASSATIAAAYSITE